MILISPTRGHNARLIKKIRKDCKSSWWDPPYFTKTRNWDVIDVMIFSCYEDCDAVDGKVGHCGVADDDDLSDKSPI